MADDVWRIGVDYRRLADIRSEMDAQRRAVATMLAVALVAALLLLGGLAFVLGPR